MRSIITLKFRIPNQFYCLIFLVLVAGCKPFETRFNVVAYKQPERHERFSERFDSGAFSVNAKKNYVFVFELQPVLVEVQQADAAVPAGPASAPASEKIADDPTGVETPLPDEVWMSQIINIEVFWRPQPGRTYAQKTQTNATIVYTLFTGDDAISYEGTGFVYFRPSRDGRTIDGEVESASLFPARQVGEPVDLFGPCHLTGAFRAVRNDLALARAVQKVRRLLGPPVAAATERLGS